MDEENWALNQLELKSGRPVSREKIPKNQPCSVMLAFTMRRRRAVLKNWTMKTPLVIRRVCSDSVSLPM